MSWTPPRTWTPGEIPTAGQLNTEIRDNALALREAWSAWSAYTPTWSGALGNGTLVGAFLQVGKTVHFRITLTWGSTSTHAAAGQTLSLPVAPHSVYVNPHLVGSAVFRDTGVATYGGVAIISAGSTMALQRIGGSGSANTAVSNTSPFAFASGDQIIVVGTYEAA